MLTSFAQSRRITLAFACLLLGACASYSRSTVQTGTSTQTTVSLSGLGSAGALDLMNEASVVGDTIPWEANEVWFVLPPVFEALGVDVVTIDPDDRLIGNPEFTNRRIEGRALSTYLDCGRGLAGPNADWYAVSLQWFVRLSQTPEGTTVVTSLLDAYARPRDVGGNAVHCVSKGTLERRLRQLITSELAAVR